MSSPSNNAIRPDPVEDHGDELPPVVAVWNGILREFRNHLTVIMAAADELRAEMPPAIAFQMGDALGETERSVEGLSALVALVDAAVRTVEPTICDLDGVFQRAIRLATPSVGRRVSLSVAPGDRAGIKNRGSALECLLAALIVDLARAGARDGVDDRSPRVSLRAEATRASLAIEVESDGARPAAGSWRLLLARELASKLGATILPQPEPAAYVVQFR